MLVKIVNLSEDRFKNCRSTNFNNEYASFCGPKSLKLGAKGGRAPHVPPVEKTPPPTGTYRVTEADVERVFGKDDGSVAKYQKGLGTKNRGPASD